MVPKQVVLRSASQLLAEQSAFGEEHVARALKIPLSQTTEMKNRVSNLFAKNGVKILKGEGRGKLSAEKIEEIIRDRVALIDVGLSKSNIENGFRNSLSLKKLVLPEKIRSALWLARLHQTFEENPGLFAKALQKAAKANNRAKVAEIVSNYITDQALETGGLAPESVLARHYLAEDPGFRRLRRFLNYHSLSPNVAGLLFLYKKPAKPPSPEEIGDVIELLLRR